ncbi:MAG: ammonium transporter [Nitrospirota bacterium]|nr:ammonium transporter [Nitrospirota bacterium]
MFLKKFEIIRRRSRAVLAMLAVTLLLPLAFGVTGAGAEDTVPTIAGNAEAIATVQTNADYIWTITCAALVFLMQAGFAMVCGGFTQAKNVGNLMMKNLFDFSFGALAFWAVGFGLMFGTAPNGWFGTDGFFLSGWEATGDPWVLCFWMFQVVFAAAAATIVAGAVAERIKFRAYIAYSLVVVGFIYPVFGSWAWGSLLNGSGWLEGLGFIDFAGSTVVHSVGAWVALAGAIVAGPRIGKYGADGKPRAIPGHSLPLATLGMFLLWFGWYGFNAGSTTAASTDIALIAVNTTLAPAAGAVAAMIASWFLFRKPDLGMSINGALGGLVSITAGCANLTPGSAVLAGLIGGVLVVFSVMFFDRIRVDDPVGAVSVHGVCGAWGTLAAGLFNADGFSMAQIGVQLIGIGSCFVWAFGTGFILFKVISATIGLRASREEELQGLDISEHGCQGYHDLTMSNIK